MTMKNKRGLSDIVATLIIILLVIVAAGIIWVVVRNVVQSGADQIELGQRCLAVNIEYVGVVETSVGSGIYNVTLARRAGGQDMAGVKITLFNNAGDNSGIIDFPAMTELQTRTMPAVNNVSLSNATRIEWTPFFEDSAGRDMVCQNTRERIF